MFGIFPEINHPAIGYTTILGNPPYEVFPHRTVFHRTETPRRISPRLAGFAPGGLQCVALERQALVAEGLGSAGRSHGELNSV